MHGADRVRRHAGLWKGDTDQAIASYDVRELVLAPPVRSFGPDREHEEPVLRIGVLDSDFDVFGKIEAELGEDLAGPAHDATPVVRRPVPLGRVSEDRARIA
jgi:hypothetical protein